MHGMCNNIHAMYNMQHATESVQQKKIKRQHAHSSGALHAQSKGCHGMLRAACCTMYVACCTLHVARLWAVHLIDEGRPPLARRRHMHLSEQEARSSFVSRIRIIATSIRIISTLIRIIGTLLGRQRCQKLSEEEAHQRTPLGLSTPSLSATVMTIAIRTTQVSSGTHRRPKGIRPHGVRCGMCVNICAGIAAHPHLRGAISHVGRDSLASVPRLTRPHLRRDSALLHGWAVHFRARRPRAPWPGLAPAAG